MSNDIDAKLEAVFREQFSKSIYAAGRRDYYDVKVMPDGTGDDSIELVVTFKRGERYCCMEPGCHFGLWEQSDWRQIRDIMENHGLGDFPALTIHRLRVIVEDGALFGLKRPGDSRELRPKGRYTYEVGTFSETAPEVVPRVDE